MRNIKRSRGWSSPMILVIMVTQDAHRYPGQAKLADYVTATCPEHVIVGARTPYELGQMPPRVRIWQPTPAALRHCAKLPRCWWVEAKPREAPQSRWLS